ncbi:MAG: patatin family protein [Bacteroidaceae bacterium]
MKAGQWTMNKQTGLVLEGGGMRGVFTCGVLDCFMDHGLRFPYAIGVSAGACNGLSYMSNQRGRAKYSNIDLLDRYHYIGLRHLLTKRNIMDFDLLFGEFPQHILPYDYDYYFHSGERFVMVTTNCLTGRADYWEEKSDPQRLVDIARASCSLPYVCPIVRIDGVPMLDGGIVDSIPLQRAMSDGYDRCVVVLTRNRGYRKTERDIRVPHFIYRQFPRLRVALSNRCRVYNEQLALVERMEDEGRILAIRPERPVEVDRIEKNTDRLRALYDEGYACADRLFQCSVLPSRHQK